MLDMSKDKKRKPGRKPSPDSKRAKGEDRHAQPRKAFHGPPELFAALDAYVERTKPQPPEAAVMRLALEQFLEREGLWPPKES